MTAQPARLPPVLLPCAPPPVPTSNRRRGARSGWSRRRGAKPAIQTAEERRHDV